MTSRPIRVPFTVHEVNETADEYCGGECCDRVTQKDRSEGGYGAHDPGGDGDPLSGVEVSKALHGVYPRPRVRAWTMR